MDYISDYLGEVMNIIELAKQANGEPAWTGGVDWTWEELAKFAALVEEAARVDEREECAAMCMAVPRTGAYFARLIRVRGTT